MLLYSFDAGNRDKQQRAREWRDALSENHGGGTRWQVLSEFYRDATRKLGGHLFAVAAAERGGRCCPVSKDFQEDRHFRRGLAWLIHSAPGHSRRGGGENRCQPASNSPRYPFLMKLTRRKLAAALIAPAAASTQTPQPAADAVQSARDRIKANGDILAKIDIPMDLEPAFQFKA